MTSFEVFKNSPLANFIHKVSMAPSKWIKVDKWDYFGNGSQDFFSLFSSLLIYFFKYETIVRSSAWYFGHSDPDPCSVCCNCLEKTR